MVMTVAFWKMAGERAIKTVAQSALAFIGSGSVGLFDLNWPNLLSVALGAGLLSILTSIAIPSAETKNAVRAELVNKVQAKKK
jgi:hypothetical protein